MRSLLLVCLLSLACVPAAHAAPAYVVSGGFLLGDPVAALALDACGTKDTLQPVAGSPQEGLDSSCVALPSGLAGFTYTVTARDATGTAAIVPCFYTADGLFISCEDATIPSGAAFVGMASLTGVNVEWTLTVG